MKHTVFFLGTPEFAVPSLRALIESDVFDVTLCITQPDKPVGRTQALTPPPVKALAESQGIPVFQPESLNASWDERPVQEVPDFLVTVAYGQLLKEHVLNAASIAPINVHASLLPRWRGASPIQHAILHGDRESGVTIQRMVKALDAGPILGKASVVLSERETASTLHNTLSTLGADLLVRTLSKELHEEEQDESQVTLCGKLSRSDGELDPLTMSAEEIDRRVRALVPWPGTRMMIEGAALKVVEAALAPTRDSMPVPCAKGTEIHIVRVQQPGKTVMTAAEWQRGRR